MVIVNEKEFPETQVVVHVDRERCDGCAMCIDSCPANALEVVDSKNRPGKKVIFIHAKLCQGCGVCEGTCPKEAIFIPGLSLDDLRGYLDRAINMDNIIGREHLPA
jgi:heterodisulfide reductase subunit A